MTKKSKNTKSLPDPYAKREAVKYEHPIPSREFILQRLAERAMPLGMEQIAHDLGIRSERDLDALSRRLKAMERDGQLIRNRRGDYGVAAKMDLVRGRVIGHPDGYGFLVPDEAGEDVFLPAHQMRALLHGDRAVVSVTGLDRRGRREGAVVEVLERNTARVVGRFYLERGVGFVTPDNKRISQDIIVPADEQGTARHGQIVMVELVAQPSARAQPVGRVVEILGEHMAPGMEIDVAIRAHNLPYLWPAEVEQEIAALAPEVPEHAKQGREDIRALPLVTIDGADARDFDDAVFCERQGKHWRLLVAIADVSSYVRPNAALDKEALTRGNSVYFPQRVIPMLPEALSNGLCSLNPHVDRLCMACEMEIDAKGRIKKHRFFEGVMRSHARLTYDEVAAMLIEGDAALCANYSALMPHLRELYALYQALRAAREQRGAIDFETTETRIVFGAGRKIEKIIPVVRNDAHKLIEECMISANVCAGEFLLRHDMPGLYRIHQGPEEQKLTDLRAFLSGLGLSLGGGEQPEPRHYAKLLDSVRARPDAHLIQTVLLRSLAQAVYSPANSGHFGLALESYAHFTSPIRRYPDLVVHRAIRHKLAGKPVEKFAHDPATLHTFGEHCSMSERRADDATRDAVTWLKCEYMMDKIGEAFDGIVTGVTGFGLFVELKDIYIEGLVHVTALTSDYYHFDPAQHRLTGERTRTVYRLGDKVRVKVMRVDLDNKKIDFEIEQPASRKTGKPGKKRKRR
ncbi:MAG: ribonuclease R [Gammaproteobacteria bacterium]|nr:MAG: ribonuclease R [Gammaproteobacteria bacterium]